MERMRKHVDDQRDPWETLARKSPMWAACTKGKRHVDWQLDEFLATGDQEVSWASSVARERQIYPIRRSLAVDFGCGPGRLIGALRKKFGRVVGIDISLTMLSLAQSTHREDGVSFSESTKQLQSDSADLVYSTFVLQHLRQDQVDECFREFTRILHPGGLLIFQYPARPRWTLPGIAFLLLPTTWLNAVQRHILHYPAIMPMSWMDPRRITRSAAACGLVIVEHRTGPVYSPNWKDLWYFARKSGEKLDC
jgi:ubiquinone/menaquinone biosynthesis C-methylase UbiE